MDALLLCPAGTQNYSGLSVFTVVPVEGSIAPGQSVDIRVCFQPDHSSENYRDRLIIKLVNQVSTEHRGPSVHVLRRPTQRVSPSVSQTHVCVMDLRGAASSRDMFLRGGDPLGAPTQSLLPPLIRSQPQLTGTVPGHIWSLIPGSLPGRMAL